MRNFIIIHHFTDSNADQDFRKQIKDKFPEHKEEEFQEVQYFAFPAKEQTAVEDNINEIIGKFGIGSEDYVALYYTRPEKPDEINRLMLLGHDEFIETHLEKVPKQKHFEMLGYLLEFDFLKERFKA